MFEKSFILLAILSFKFWLSTSEKSQVTSAGASNTALASSASAICSGCSHEISFPLGNCFRCYTQRIIDEIIIRQKILYLRAHIASFLSVYINRTLLPCTCTQLIILFTKINLPDYAALSIRDTSGCVQTDNSYS